MMLGGSVAQVGAGCIPKNMRPLWQRLRREILIGECGWVNGRMQSISSFAFDPANASDFPAHTKGMACSNGLGTGCLSQPGLWSVYANHSLPAQVSHKYCP